MSWGSAVHLALPPETIFQMFMVQQGRRYSGQCFRASGEPLVVDILTAHTEKASRSLQWHWLGDWLGAGGRAEPPGRVQVWEQHVEEGRLDHRWAQGHASVLHSSAMRVPQKHFPLNQNFPNSLLLRLEYISVLMN